MSSGYSVSGKGDLDDLFDAYQGGNKPGVTNIRVGSQDLRDRYSPRAEGDDIGHDTGYRVGSQDLRAIFAAAGTSTKAKVIPFGGYSGDSAGSHDAGASFDLVLSADGTWDITVNALQGGTSGSPTSGTWHKDPGSGAGNSYEVRFLAHITAGSTGTVPDGTYTPTTGWLRLSSARGVSADTAHITSGGSPQAGSSTVDGYWYVDIRKVGSTVVRRSTCHISLRASSI